MRGPAPAVAVVLALTVAPTAATSQPVKDDITARVIRDSFVVRVPAGSCSVADLAAWIGRSTATPTGVETLPGPCTPDARESDATEVIQLQGMNLADALNTLVKVDPRYYWTESDGVIVVRPLAAWTDRKHFLHTTLKALKLDKASIGAALVTAMAPVRPGPTGGDAMAGVGEISVDVGPISIVEALDLIVRTHGELRWEVRYCRREALLVYATIAIYTFDVPDTQGLLVRGPRPLDVNGKP